MTGENVFGYFEEECISHKEENVQSQVQRKVKEQGDTEVSNRLHRINHEIIN